MHANRSCLMGIGLLAVFIIDSKHKCMILPNRPKNKGQDQFFGSWLRKSLNIFPIIFQQCFANLFTRRDWSGPPKLFAQVSSTGFVAICSFNKPTFLCNQVPQNNLRLRFIWESLRDDFPWHDLNYVTKYTHSTATDTIISLALESSHLETRSPRCIVNDGAVSP